MTTDISLSTILPLTLLTIWASALLLVDLFVPKERKEITACLRRSGWL
jgi:hypothetical protein